MNKEVKEKWLAALRSGEYKQGRGKLCSLDKEYCCLGVLTDLYAKEHNQEWEKSPDLDSAFSFDFFKMFTPEKVVRWAGLERQNPIIEGIGLSAYNDGDYELDPHSFEEIANLIEEHL